MPDSLDGKVALVTGSARRVGAAIVRRLHGAGAKVIIHYRDSDVDAAKLESELNARARAQRGEGEGRAARPSRAARAAQRRAR